MMPVHQELKAVAPAAGRFFLYALMIFIVLIVWVAISTHGFTDWPNTWERLSVWWWSYQEQHYVPGNHL